MMRSYMLSYLAEQAESLGAGFAQRFANPWLVWEPGNWHPPKREAETSTDVALPTGPNHPSSADALCFELKSDLGGPGLHIGRDPTNDVVVNDATVSREHLMLIHEAGAWLARPVAGRLVKVGGIATSFDSKVHSGIAITLGSVQLTFYDPAGLLGRLGRGKVKA